VYVWNSRKECAGLVAGPAVLTGETFPVDLLVCASAHQWRDELGNCILREMNSIQEWPAVLRLVWVTGGIVAVNEPAETEVSIKSSVAGRPFATLTINTYAEIFSALRSLGFRTVGTTFVTNAQQLEGPNSGLPG
jgi:hypothetical protein